MAPPLLAKFRRSPFMRAGLIVATLMVVVIGGGMAALQLRCQLAGALPGVCAADESFAMLEADASPLASASSAISGAIAGPPRMVAAVSQQQLGRQVTQPPAQAVADAPSHNDLIAATFALLPGTPQAVLGDTAPDVKSADAMPELPVPPPLTAPTTRVVKTTTVRVAATPPEPGALVGRPVAVDEIPTDYAPLAYGPERRAPSPFDALDGAPPPSATPPNDTALTKQSAPPTSTAAAATAPAAVLPPRAARIGDSSTAVRAHPTNSADRLFALAPHTSVTVTAKEKGWLYVDDGEGHVGWAYSGLIEDVATAETTGQKAVAESKPPATIAALLARKSADAAAPPPTGSGQTKIVGGKGAIVRSGPANANARLFALAAGAKVTITDTRLGWFQIVDADGRAGWIYSSLLND